MGLTEFLVGGNAPAPSNLPESIEALEDASTIFVRRWNGGDTDRAGKVSKDAMVHFEYIVGEFLRERGDRRRARNYSGSAFEHEMNQVVGRGVTGVSAADQAAMHAAGPGMGRIPGNVGRPMTLSLEQMLNKIKHRNTRLVNFRIDNGRHVFLICPEQTDGRAEGIYEFDVLEFCAQCKKAAEKL